MVVPTKSVALAAFPVPPSVEATAVVVLRKLPAAEASTLTLKVQVALGASVAPDRLTTPDPAVALIVPPPHPPDNPLGVATSSPTGNVSVKPIPDRARAGLGFVRMKFRRVTWDAIMAVCAKNLEIDGGSGVLAGATKSASWAMFPGPA